MERDSTERSRRVTALVEGLLARVRAVEPGALYRPKAGEWTAMQVLAHVAEMVPFWARQAREVSEQDQDEELFGRATANAEEDPERLGAVEQHGSASVQEMERRLRSGLERAIEDLPAIRPGAWGRTGRLASGQTRTVAEIVDQLLITHLEDHTRQVDGLLKGS